MNRRSFMQSMAAAFSAAATGLSFRPRVPLINYDLFTCPFVTKYTLAQPFGVDGTVYATDSRVLVSHAGELDADDGARRLPNVAALDWHEFDTGGFKTLRAARYTMSRSQDCGSYCPDCCGTGRVGNVRRTFDEYEYEERWIGGRKCDRCDGKRWVDDTFHECHGSGQFCPALMVRIRTLGPLDVKVIEYGRSSVNGHNGEVMLFRGDNGIRGMLMGMCK